MWNSRVPKECVDRYPGEPWRCFFGHRLYPSLQTPLFVVQYQYDEFQVHIDGMTGRAQNEYEKMQYIRTLSDKIRLTLANVSAVFAPSCMSHIMLTKLDWHKTSIRGMTLPEAINCWEQNPVVSNHHAVDRHNHHQHHQHSTQFSNQRPNVYGLLNSKHYYNSMTGNYHKISNNNNNNNQPQTSGGGSSEMTGSDELSQFYNTRLDFQPQTPSMAGTNRKARQSDEARRILRASSNERAEQRDEERAKSNQTAAVVGGLNENSIAAVQAKNGHAATTNVTVSGTTGSPHQQQQQQQQSGGHKLNKKRKKRKRRKHHKHNQQQQHNNNNSQPTAAETSTSRSTVYLNEGPRGRRREEENMPPPRRHHHVTGGDELEWPDNGSQPHQPQPVQHDEPKCDYRLIDDHSFLKRNYECPRLYKTYMD